MNAKLRSKLGLAGGLLGAVAIAGLAALLGVNREPEEGYWGLVGAVILAAPYGLALIGAFEGRAAVRGPLFLAAAVTSLLFTGILFELGPALLPATIVLFIAAVGALRKSRLSIRASAARALAAMVGAALLVGSFFALYTSDNERCWETVRYPDGSEETRSTERFGGGFVGPFGTPVETSRGTGTAVEGGCVSDVVTAKEAAQGLLVTSAGVVFLVLVARLGLRVDPGEDVART